MAKINFTEANLAQLKELAIKFLMENRTITYGIGNQVYSIVTLMHTTSINTLNNIRLALSKMIEAQESKDEWTDPDNSKLALLKENKELVNLIIGWKRKNLEIAENKKMKEKLTQQLAALKESTKTPEDRIKELEAKLKEYDEF